ncbi:MAG: cardiolipin synthase ClsB [Pseudomonadota bacterium]
MSSANWVDGNTFDLLENGEEFFPAVFSAIEAAQEEVLIETFILFEDKVGVALHSVLLDAAHRGVRVHVTVDGYGSPELSSQFIETLTDAGVQLHVFDPPPRLGRNLQPFRRLHRKIVVVDGHIGFIGGLNFSADHLGDFGPEAKQDYAVRAQGPIVTAMHQDTRRILAMSRKALNKAAPAAPAASLREPGRPTPRQQGARARLVTRDNQRHRTDIEREYRLALGQARREVVIANAYFLPGYRLLRSLKRAAKRGVKVQLVLQGQPDIQWVTVASRMLYDQLLKAGVCVYEYCERPMHGKVAVIDDEWSTIGSSNLDPLSLSLNLEANLVIQDRTFNAALRTKLQGLLDRSCVKIERSKIQHPWWLHLGVGTLIFHILRHFPQWASRLPAHRPRMEPAGQTPVVVANAPAAVEAWHWRNDEPLSMPQMTAGGQA